VLEEKEIRRVGGEVNIPIDVRVIAATNQDLQTRCRQQEFRLDLYYRLSILPLHIPPLRERREDILILARHFLQTLQKDDKPMTQRLQQVLCAYPWEGNVRELYNCIQYMSYLCGDVLDVDLLPDDMQVEAPSPEPEKRPADLVCRDFPPGDWDELLQIMHFLEWNRTGREEIMGYLRKQMGTVSEYRVRQLLKELKDKGLVSYTKGRGGVQLTALARQKLQSDRV
jgi:DNA-binding NtrC family response regulator